MVNKSRLFTACCIALVTTAMTFAIRAGILSKLGTEFGLSGPQLGFINSMAFWGFPLATVLGGFLYNRVGARNLMIVAFICHLLGLLLTIFAGGYWGLLISTFFIGFANGSVEAGANPLIAGMYANDQSTWLNKFHVWFPGGIVIGALLSGLMTNMNTSWQLQIAVMLVPAIMYGVLIFGQKFPVNNYLEEDTGKNIKSLFAPLFIFMAICMTLTATTELGTQQWIEKILGKAGAHPMLILAMITGLMAVGRYFAGPVIHRLNPTGVLWGSAIIATFALVLMSQATGAMVYVAAILFAIGVMYFWPTMLGFVSEYMPNTGALGLGVMGAAGMFATGLWQPVIGGWLDTEKQNALNEGLSSDAAELVAGQATLDNLAVFPAILILAFGLLYFYVRKKYGKRKTHQS